MLGFGMLQFLPSDETLYTALLERNPDYEGRAYVGVTSTGIFCRLTCPARKPKRENCRFYETVAECMQAGFRPCRRCNPLQSITETDPTVNQLLAALNAAPGHRWSETELSTRGYDPSTVRRTFKRHFGITFLEMARFARLHSGVETIAQGGRVIDAQLDAGFDSPSGFQDALARLLGQPPQSRHKAALLKVDWIPTPLGPMLVVADRTRLHLLEFVDRKGLPTELRKLSASVKGDLAIGR